MSYILVENYLKVVDSVKNLQTMAFVPFDPANTDYQQFKTDVAAGVPLEDAEGVLMTQEQVDEFLRTIP